MKVIERQHATTAATSRMYPRVIAGICEFCGVINPALTSQFQYTLCDHFKDIGELRCSYCPATINPEEVTAKADLKIHEHPDNPDKLVVVCDSYTCSQKHLARFER